MGLMPCFRMPFKYIHIILGVLILLGFSSCQSEQERRQVMIQGMENAVKKNTADEFVRPLVANYIQYASDYINDHRSSYYLYKAAVLYFRVGNQGEAIAQLERILREHPNCEIIEDVYLTLGMMCATGGYQKERAEEIYTLYADKYPNGKGSKQIKLFYAPPIDRVNAQIKDLQQKLKKGSRLGVYNKELSNQLLWAYIDYIGLDSLQQDMSMIYCMQGAQLAIRSGLHLVAIELLDHSIRYDTNPSRRGKAMLLLASEYNNELKTYLTRDPLISSAINDQINPVSIRSVNPQNKAKEIYKQIIREYPNDDIHIKASNFLRQIK